MATTAMSSEEFTSNPKNVDEWNRMWESGKYDPLHDVNVSKFIVNNYETFVSGRNKMKVFFPLCGKDVGMKWLADRGHEIVGVEGSEHAVKGFFADQHMEYITEHIPAFGGDMFKNKDGNIRIYCGDFFKFNSAIENKFDGVWDRGGFGSLEPVDRPRFADIMLSDCLLTGNVRYFMETFEGEPEEGLVSENLLKQLFKVGERFSLKRVEYEKEEDDADEDGWVRMVQVHLLQGLS